MHSPVQIGLSWWVFVFCLITTLIFICLYVISYYRFPHSITTCLCRYLSNSVWPDIDIKGSPMFWKVPPKSSGRKFYLKVMLTKQPNKSGNIWAILSIKLTNLVTPPSIISPLVDVGVFKVPSTLHNYRIPELTQRQTLPWSLLLLLLLLVLVLLRRSWSSVFIYQIRKCFNLPSTGIHEEKNEIKFKILIWFFVQWAIPGLFLIYIQSFRTSSYFYNKQVSGTDNIFYYPCCNR